jgi:hypothetical protein
LIMKTILGSSVNDVTLFDLLIAQNVNKRFVQQSFYII